MKIWQRFLNGHPTYLACHYWWAYLWRTGVWFFDHQPIINAILFGQYKNLLNCTLKLIKKSPPSGNFLQLTCVYGELTSKLLNTIKQPLHLADVAQIQLKATRDKLKIADQQRLITARMNAERLGYGDDEFSCILIFFLLHEMPAEARKRTLSEVMRTLQPGGRIIVVEYAALPEHHLLWRFPLTRFILTYLEPFLNGFWHENLLAKMQLSAEVHGKQVCQIEEHFFFFRFYRVTVFEVSE